MNPSRTYEPEAREYLLTASHCCVCRKALKDAESVEHGIGPKCSRKYYNPRHTPTREQVMRAMGLLAQSNLPDDLKNACAAKRDQARLLSNLLVKYASSVYDKRDKVFVCASIARALGYVELADKLEEDRTKARIRDLSDGSIEAFFPYKFAMLRDMEKIPGNRRLPEKMGSKIGFVFPKEQQRRFELVLGIHYGNELACGDGKIWKIRRYFPRDLQAFLNPPLPAAVSTPVRKDDNVSITKVGSSLQIRTPYNGNFLSGLKGLVPWKERKWNDTNPNDKFWNVDATHTDGVKRLINIHYGVQL